LRRCLRCLGRSCAGRGGRAHLVAPADFGVSLLVACVGAAIVVGVSFNVAANSAASAEGRVFDVAADMTQRMRLVFEPAAAVMRAAAAASAEIDMNLTSWGRMGPAMFKVRARMHGGVTRTVAHERSAGARGPGSRWAVAAGLLGNACVWEEKGEVACAPVCLCVVGVGVCVCVCGGKPE
jgi:hypothetical protein